LNRSFLSISIGRILIRSELFFHWAHISVLRAVVF